LHETVGLNETAALFLVISALAIALLVGKNR
jgi:hypothetical protein